MRNKISLIIFCAASVLALWAVANTKPVSLYTVNVPYEYPYVPGTQEWIDLGSTSTRRQASQVPDELLQSMATDALLQTVLDYPFLSDIYAFNTMKMGYEVLSHYCQTNYSLSKKERTLEDYMAEHLYWLYASGDLEYTS